ncbi:Ion transport protein [Oscillatoria nigro-viridis PCC 7112]|uniref:Ion transport protein n=1 Tax=Phormidium nigroviride PCC 7112 TaxID=179408 RepID=K9VAM1_9CYAN|nr:ion transporter [Oscillatoria nigro-viridis]AFZ04724.1 Ion transport protein [Oscillatoria nigro-viridis PCC 7112]
MPKQIKSQIYAILEKSELGNFYSLADDIFITCLIAINVAAFIASTSPTLSQEQQLILENIEIVSSLVFTIEYLLRLWVCTVDSRYSHPFWGRLRYGLTPLSLIDLISILPFYSLLLFPNLSFVNLIRLLRLLRLLKMSRYSESLRTLGAVLYAKKEELIATAFAVFILLIFASSVMYFVENEAHPETFASIPDAMWWGVVTLTTVGYGDIYPITPLGKFLGAILAFLGIGIFALPAGLIAAGFSEEVQRKKQEKMAANLEQSANFQAVKRLAEIEVGFEQKQRAIALHVESSSELMKMCVQTAKQKLGSDFKNEQIICDLAIHLYNEAVRKFEL